MGKKRTAILQKVANKRFARYFLGQLTPNRCKWISLTSLLALGFILYIWRLEVSPWKNGEGILGIHWWGTIAAIIVTMAMYYAQSIENSSAVSVTGGIYAKIAFITAVLFTSVISLKVGYPVGLAGKLFFLYWFISILWAIIGYSWIMIAPLNMRKWCALIAVIILGCLLVYDISVHYKIVMRVHTCCWRQQINTPNLYESFFNVDPCPCWTGSENRL